MAIQSGHCPAEGAMASGKGGTGGAVGSALPAFGTLVSWVERHPKSEANDYQIIHRGRRMNLRLVCDNTSQNLSPETVPVAQEFEQFWKAYPRKVKKGDAAKAWQQTKSLRPSIADIVKALEQAKRSDAWRRDGGQYIPYPATWLRAWGWLDEYEIEVAPMDTWQQDGKKWYETASGIEAKGRELGITPDKFHDVGGWPAFKTAVLQKAKSVGDV